MLLDSFMPFVPDVKKPPVGLVYHLFQRKWAKQVRCRPKSALAAHLTRSAPLSAPSQRATPRHVCAQGWQWHAISSSLLLAYVVCLTAYAAPSVFSLGPSMYLALPTLCLSLLRLIEEVRALVIFYLRLRGEVREREGKL